jgi:tetratricopeptide (TPR) repeat protein
VTTKIARVSYLGASPAQTLKYLRDIEPIAAALPGQAGSSGDPLLLAQVHYWIGRYLFLVNAPREAITWYRKVLEQAPSLGDPELLALPSSVIGRALVSQGYFEQAIPLLRQAVEPLEAIGNTIEWIHTLNFLCSALAGHGEIEEGLQWSDRALARAREIRSPTALSLSYIHRWAAHMHAGDVPAMLQVARTLVASAEEAGDPVTLYVGLGFLAWSQAAAARFPAAQATMQRCRAVADELGTQLVIADWFASVEADIALGLGRPAEALDLAERAVELARSLDGVFAEARAQRAWAQALAATSGSAAQVDARMAASIQAAEAGGALPEIARTQATWAELCHNRGDAAGALAHLRQAHDATSPAMAGDWRDAIMARLRSAEEAPGPAEP